MKGLTVSHKFKLRQYVRITQTSVVGTSAGGTWQVVRLMPADQTGELAYRIKAGESERAAREGEIAAV